MQHAKSFHRFPEKRTEIFPDKIPMEFYESSKSMHRTESFHQFLEEQAEIIPNKVAIEFCEDSISYMELNNKSNEFAHYLKTLKLKRGDRVGIYANRSIELLIILMGILKCGAVCVPIDINLPETQTGYILNRTKLNHMITYGLNVPKFINNLVGNVIEYNAEDFSDYPKSNLNLNIKSSDLSYILYTSGSTGKPKGVELEHNGIVNLAFGKVKFIRLHGACRILQFSSVAFDAMLSEIGIQMLMGGTLVMAKYDDILPGKPLIKTLNENKINVIISAPSVLGVIQNAILPYMQVIISAGEACPPRLANKLSKNYMFVNAYGPTEASVCSTMYHVVNQIEDSMNTVPIGKPIGGVKIKLLNKEMEEVGFNEVGELYVGGICVARGYFVDLSLTEEKFVILNGERFFKTGDLVRCLEDGNLEYIGRIDRQIKYHGIRVNLNEIEKIIDEHRDVDISAAIFKDGNLIVYIQKKPHSKLNSKELRRFLEKKIPTRIFPDLFFFVPKIKLTISNKIDYKFLEKHSKKQDQAILVDTLNWSEDEVSLLEILRNLLIKCNDIRLHDDFFDLGLNSFIVAEFSDEISKKFNIDMPISKIYECSNIKQMANHIKNIRTGNRESSVDFLKESEFKKIFTRKNYNPNKIERGNIFLTGATGYIGAFLLHELLTNTNSVIYCLIRSSNELSALKRLLKVAEKYHIDISSPKYSSRIEVVLGDISKPFFGMKEKDFCSLNENIDIIYHLASNNNFIMPYSALYPANVFGSKEILHLATIEKIIPIHYVSTLAIFSCIHFFKDVKQIDEFSNSNDSVDYLKYDIGYVQTKWVSDQLMQNASKNNVPITIYRPGFVLCHSKTKAIADNQFWHNFINECVKLGSYPGLVDQKEELVSVDFVCKSILHLSKLKESIGQVYHLCPKAGDNMSSIECFKKLSELYGNKMEQLPYAEWLKLVKKDFDAAGKNNKLFPFLSLLSDKAYKNLTVLELYQNTPDCFGDYTAKILSKANIFATPMDDLLEHYTNSLLKS